MKLSKILNVSTIDSLVRFLNVLTGSGFCDKKFWNQVDFLCVVYKIARFVVTLI